MPVTGDTRKATGREVVLQPGEGRVIPLGEVGVVTMKASRADSGGTISAYEFVLPAATAGPPLHLHRSWDETFFVVEGIVTFVVDGIVSSAPAGSLVFVPRGIEHTFWNESDLPARQLTVFSPSGIEDYFDALHSDMTSGTDASLESANALMEAHDMVAPQGDRRGYGAIAGQPGENG
jgi:mannose-6-phosphate isomerase-like protein (cupin superfamily)